MSDGNKYYRTYVLFILTLVYMINFIDRQIIGILSPAIKADMGFTDVQLGWLKGLPFAVFYCVMGIPLAWMADRNNRKRLVVACLTIWSAFTAFTGLAGTFAHMLLARIGVGIGEAGGVPPSHSILSDLYPKEKRASALGIFSLGVPLGLGFSFIVAGQLIAKVGWRGTLVVLGICGIALALLMLFSVKEPKRGQLDKVDVKPIGLIDSAKFLSTNSTWVAICAGFTFSTFAGYATSTWFLDYIARFDPEYAPGGTKFGGLMNLLGLIYLFGAGLGTVIGAKIADWLGQRNVSFYGWVPAIAMTIALPTGVYAFWAQSVTAFLVFWTIYVTACNAVLGPTFAVAQTIATPNTRAMSSALILLIANLIGLGGGPTIIGYVSQFYSDAHGDLHGLRLALTWIIIPYILTILAYFVAGVLLPKAWKKAESLG